MLPTGIRALICRLPGRRRLPSSSYMPTAGLPSLTPLSTAPRARVSCSCPSSTACSSCRRPTAFVWLAEIAAHLTDVLHVWGTTGLEDGTKTLDVQGWELVNMVGYETIEGTVETQEDGQRVLLGITGETFILPAVPADLKRRRSLCQCHGPSRCRGRPPAARLEQPD